MAEADPAIVRGTAVPVAEPTKPKRNWLRLLLMLSVPLLLVFGAYQYYKANENIISTDNAYVQQDKVSVSSEVAGRIVEVGVRENQPVRAGDLLFRVDAAPFRISLEQANASIASAQVKVTGLETDYETKGVDISSAQEDIAFFTKEYQRQSVLMQRGFTTRARLQAAEHALSEARTKLAKANADAIKSRAALSTGSAVPGENPAVVSAKVQREKAMLDLSRTSVYAPVSGIISQANRLHVGQMMVTGLPAVTIVGSDQSWVEANFKETDLARMRVGQPADLSFDAYPDMTLRGRVASIGAGTGSEFSVLPAQNANGNWVKVTQRIPVRIAIDSKPGRTLIAGLSVKVRIDTSK